MPALNANIWIVSRYVLLIAFTKEKIFLVIHPDECIDCGVCEPECPADAISDDTCDDAQKWIDINREYAEKWPNINKMGTRPSDSDDWKDVKGKFEKHFSPNPGKGS